MAAVQALKRASGASYTTSILEADTIVCGGLERSTSGVAALYTDNNVTTITIGGGTNQSTITMGKAGQTVNILGDLSVQGTTWTSQAEQVNVGDNHFFMNAGYTVVAAQTGGLVVNRLPTSTNDTVATGGFTAGVPATSNPTVITTGSATFSVGDLIQVSGANNVSNDGLFEVLSHVGTTLTIRGIGTTGTVEDFTQNQFTTDATVAGTITKINVNVLRVGTDGLWEVGGGSATGVSFTDLSVGAPTLTQVLVAGNTTGGNHIVLTSGDEVQGAPGVGGGNATVRGGAATTGNGGIVYVTGGTAGTNNAGGNVIIRGGVGGGAAGTGGSVQVIGEDGGLTGGSVSMLAGDGTNVAGDIWIRSGDNVTNPAGTVYIRTGSSAANGDIKIGDTNVGTITIGNTTVAAVVVRADSGSDVSFEARGISSPLTLNQASDIDLDAGFTATSIVGCLNELKTSPAAAALSAVLAVGNTTGGNDIVLTTGDALAGQTNLLFEVGTKSTDSIYLDAETTDFNHTAGATDTSPLTVSYWLGQGAGGTVAQNWSWYSNPATGTANTLPADFVLRYDVTGTPANLNVFGKAASYGHVTGSGGSSLIYYDSGSISLLAVLNAWLESPFGYIALATNNSTRFQIENAGDCVLVDNGSGGTLRGDDSTSGAGGLVVLSSGDTSATTGTFAAGNMTLESGSVTNAGNDGNAGILYLKAGTAAGSGTDGDIEFWNNGSAAWKMSSKHLIAASDNLYDIGASGANRPRRGYFGTEVVIGSSVRATTDQILFTLEKSSDPTASTDEWYQYIKNVSGRPEVFFALDDGAAGTHVIQITNNGSLNASQTLAQTLALGNTTGGTDIVVSSGDQIVSPDGSAGPGTLLEVKAGAGDTNQIGGTLNLYGGAGNGSAAGGPAYLYGGGGGTTGAGALARVVGGNGGATSGNGGSGSVYGGWGYGSGATGGEARINGGNSQNGNGGLARMYGGNGGTVGGTGNGGDITIAGGNSGGTSGNGGDITINGGSGTTTNGSISIGSSNTNNTAIRCGASAQILMQSGSGGSIAIQGNSAATTVTIGNNSYADTITVGSTNTTASTTINSGATGDITFDARGMTTPITLNQTGDLDLDAGFTATSIIGALNELKTSPAAAALSAVLAVGNTTGGTDISVTTGDSIIGAAELTLSAASGVMDLDATGALSINSSGGVINIGNDAVAQNINIGTNASAQRITTIGGGGTHRVHIKGGTNDTYVEAAGGDVIVGYGTSATTRVGNTTGTHSVTVEAGTGGIFIGNNSAAMAVNLGTGGTGAKTVTIGDDTVAGSTVSIRSGSTGDITLDARGATTPITVNESGNTDLDSSFTATSIIGALNELKTTAGTATYLKNGYTNGNAGTVLQGEALYHTTTASTVDKSTGSTDAIAARFIGVAEADAATATTVQCVSEGKVALKFETGHSSPTPGDEVFLSATEAGRFTTTAPSSSGNVVLSVGFVSSIDGTFATTLRAFCQLVRGAKSVI